jgi:hypothetical protein
MGRAVQTRKISPAELATGDILCGDDGRPFAVLTFQDGGRWDTLSYPSLDPFMVVEFPPASPDVVIVDVPRITPDLAGTWLDGWHGWHNVYRVVDRAVEYGFTVPDDAREALEWFRKGDHTATDDASYDMYEAVAGQRGLCDMATEFLSARAPEGYVFVWDAGELSLMTVEDAENF